MTTNRRLLLRWLGWFGLFNAAVLAVISLQYLSGYQAASGPLAWTYLFTIYVSHHAGLALLPLALAGLPVIALGPRKTLLMTLGILLMAVLIALITLDSLLWSQSHFHINLLTARILGWQSWLFAGVMFAIALIFESFLARGAWNWVATGSRRAGGRIAMLIILCGVIAQGIYAWSDASYYTPVTSLAQQLPVHRGVTAKSFLSSTGLVDLRQSRERRLADRVSSGMNQGAAGQLAYPLAPLECRNERPLNLLVIMLDAWRFDMLNPVVTPRIAAWADGHASRFEQHFSGGNSSRMGVFSFFYGLPPGYFKSFEAIQKPALLVQELQRQGYRMGLYTAADMYRPVTLDRTAFASVPNLRLTPEDPGAPAWQRDRNITNLWFDFLDSATGDAPFLGFLLYDAPNAKKAPEGRDPGVVVAQDHPMRERFKSYQAAIHHTDALVGEVLDDLERRGLFDSTVVLITADHGEEFMESGPEYRVHGSGYSRFQLQVPLLVAWPGRQPVIATHRTSHYDIAPSLLGGLAGCVNPASDYSAGRDLWSGEDWSWLVAGSYYNYAVLEPDQITVTFPNGLYQVRDWNYRLLDDPDFRGDVLQEVMAANRRFYQ